MYHRALSRAIPAAAMFLGAGAIAASTSYAAPVAGGGGGAGVIVPAVDVDYNTGAVALAGFAPGAAETITVVRDGVTIATATGATGGAGTASAGLLNLNVPNIVAPEPFSCWTGFTPDILPGDTVTVADATTGTNSVVMPDFSVARPQAVGGDIVLHGTAADAITGAPIPAVDGMVYNKLNRFTVGLHGHTEISAIAGGFGTVSYDAAGSNHWTASLFGLAPADFAKAPGAISKAATVVAAGRGAPIVAITMRALFDNPGVAGPVAGCAAPLGSDGVIGSSVQTINQANANGAVTITGTADPNVKSVMLTLGGVAIPAVGTTAWSATVPASSLPEGKLLASAAYTSAAGAYHGKTMTIVKDTIAPAAPTATVPAGAYTSAQTVGLNASDGTVHYTIDGSDPTASSPKYGDAIHVNSSGTIKAVAVDAAGNVSPVAQFDYAINKPAVVQPPVVVPQPKTPKLKLDALTITSSLRLSSAHRHGIHMVVFAPDGAKVVRIKVTRNGRTIDTVMRRVTGDGVLTVVMPRSKHARHALKRGTYKVLVTPGSSASKPGATTSRTVRIR